MNQSACFSPAKSLPVDFEEIVRELRAVIQIGDPSPWGPIETVSYYPHWITYVETARHGGFHLRPDRLAKIPESWRLARFGNAANLDSPWFEEDRDWAMVALKFPGVFPARAVAEAKRVFVAGFPDLAGDLA